MFGDSDAWAVADAVLSGGALIALWTISLAVPLIWRWFRSL